MRKPNQDSTSLRKALWVTLIGGIVSAAVGLYYVLFADTLHPYTIDASMHRHGGMHTETTYPRSIGWIVISIGAILLIMAFGFYRQIKIQNHSQIGHK